MRTIAAAFHLAPAGAPVPWSGDEDYHLMQVAFLCENLPPVWLAAALVWLGFGALRSMRRGKSRSAVTDWPPRRPGSGDA